MVHTDAEYNFSVTFVMMMDCPFPVKGVSFHTIIYAPLFGLTVVLGVYEVVNYCCLVVPWEPSFL